MDDATKRELSTAADMAGLQMEFLELLRDAERYRWLRDSASLAQTLRLLNDAPGNIDAAIDAAMAAEVKT